jgi:cytochrome oxidase Cu insertion factor (SCO1/SenC/PrrC family)
MNPLRRQFTASLPALGVLLLSTRHGGLLAQTTPAAMDAVAPAMPALGNVVKLPTVTLFDGTVFHPEQAAGHITVVYWWASTCPFCALQSPEMQKFWLQHKGKGLQFLALSVDRQPEHATAYLQKRGYTFPSGWVSTEVHRALPKPRGLPVTLVMGRDGRILQAERGQMFPEDVAQMASWL